MVRAGRGLGYGQQIRILKMQQENKDYFAKTLEKGIRILTLFDENHANWSLTEIAEQLKFNMTSAYRLVNTFVELGYLKKDHQTKRLRLGPMSFVLGNRLLYGFETNKLIEPLVDEIHSRHNISIDVSLFHSRQLVKVYRRETSNTLTYRQDAVSEMLYCTASGKTVLAFLPAEKLNELIKIQSFTCRLENTITDVKVLHDDLERARQKGYALNNEEYIKGLIAIAAPILGRSTKYPLGAVSFTSTTLDHTLTGFAEQYADVVCDLAKRLSEVMPGN